MKRGFEFRGARFDLDDGVLAPFREQLGAAPDAPAVRLVYAAAHLAMEEGYAQVEQTLATPVAPDEIGAHIDWTTTFRLRERLDSLGFGIAEAMDTAQRFQIGWDNALRLIEGCGALGLRHGFVAGAGVDHLTGEQTEDQIVAGVVMQARTIRAAGGIPILLPLVWLCEQGHDEEGYVRVYGRIIEALDGPLFLHWLGEMFLPALAGYFPGESFQRIMAAHPAKLRGAKLSLLDAQFEIRLRAELLPREQIMLTGDDFHFGTLMDGGTPTGRTTIDGREIPTGDFSHGLLGIFDAIAEPASLALRSLARGDNSSYAALMGPCEVLSRHLFESPTQHYKAGLAFLAWLNDWQPNPMLVQHEQRARSVEHFVEAARLASTAGVIANADVAHTRLSEFVTRAGE